MFEMLICIIGPFLADPLGRTMHTRVPAFVEGDSAGSMVGNDFPGDKLHSCRGTSAVENFNRYGQDVLPPTCKGPLFDRYLLSFITQRNMKMAVVHRGATDLAGCRVDLVWDVLKLHDDLGIESRIKGATHERG